MPAKQLVSNFDLTKAYAELGNVHKVGALFGIHGSSVHERLVKLGVAKGVNKLTSAEEERLKLDYPTAAASGRLNDLAADMGRTKPYICRHARALGLTDRKRSKYYISSTVSINMLDWHSKNPHPRGMLGKKHSLEALAKMNAGAIVGMKIKALAGTLVKSRPSASWKSGWREFGGKRCFYRSLWEANYGRYLEWMKCAGLISEWTHEPKVFWFDAAASGARCYLPDFEVISNDNAIAYHEVKGWMDARSVEKLSLLQTYYPSTQILVVREADYTRIRNSHSAAIEGWE